MSTIEYAKCIHSWFDNFCSEFTRTNAATFQPNVQHHHQSHRWHGWVWFWSMFLFSDMFDLLFHLSLKFYNRCKNRWLGEINRWPNESGRDRGRRHPLWCKWRKEIIGESNAWPSNMCQWSVDCFSELRDGTSWRKGRNICSEQTWRYLYQLSCAAVAQCKQQQ